VAATKVFKGTTVVETVLEEVDDHLVGDVDYGHTLVEKAVHVFGPDDFLRKQIEAEEGKVERR
jgi:hypothetical protein